MEPIIPPLIPDNILMNFNGMPLYAWLELPENRHLRIEYSLLRGINTMKNIFRGQRLILSQSGYRPLLVVAQNNFAEDGYLHLRGGDGYNNEHVVPGNIHNGWNLYTMPDALAPLLDPEGNYNNDPRPPRPPLPAAAAAAPAAPNNNPKTYDGGKRRMRTRLSKKKRHFIKRRKTIRRKNIRR